MSETDEMKKIIAQQKQRRESAKQTVKEAADRVDRRREAKREQSSRRT